MLKFYQNIIVRAFIVFLLTLVVIYFCFYQSRMESALLPMEASTIPWRAVVSSDADDGGSSRYQLKESSFNIEYNFTLGDKTYYPYVSFALRFMQQELNGSDYLDLSAYDRVKFNIKCNPANILSFTVFTFDEAVSQEENMDSHRVSSAYFSCERHRKDIEIRLDKLETPDWWLRLYADLAQRDYSLEKSLSITFGNSTQSPALVDSNVIIDSLVLEGRNWVKIWLGIVLLVILWGCLGVLAFRFYIKTKLLARMKKDVPLVAYQQLSIESHKDKERASLMKFLVTEYHNPDLDMDNLIQSLGINRTKVNDILKSETGLTFNAYLNKLRLTEAARLLQENPQANVGEVAYSVGYNNVSYFNRLFKAEYGCTPKSFRSVMQDNKASSVTNPPSS